MAQPGSQPHHIAAAGPTLVGTGRSAGAWTNRRLLGAVAGREDTPRGAGHHGRAPRRRGSALKRGPRLSRIGESACTGVALAIAAGVLFVDTLVGEPAARRSPPAVVGDRGAAGSSPSPASSICSSAAARIRSRWRTCRSSSGCCSRAATASSSARCSAPASPTPCAGCRRSSCAFNLAQLALAVCVAFVIVRAIADPRRRAGAPDLDRPLRGRRCATGALTIACIAGAIAITEGGMSLGTLRPDVRDGRRRDGGQLEHRDRGGACWSRSTRAPSPVLPRPGGDRVRRSTARTSPNASATRSSSSSTRPTVR